MGTRVLIAALCAVCVFTFVETAHAEEMPDLGDTLRSARSHGGDAWLKASATDLSLKGTEFEEPYPDPEPCAPCCLKWDIALAMWLTGLNGEALIDGEEVDFDIKPRDMLDLIDKIEFLIQGRIRATYGNWMFYVAGMLMDAGDSIEASVDLPNQTVPFDVEVDLSLNIVEAAVGYCLGKCVTGHDCCGREKSRVGYAYAGFRWFNIQQDVALTPMLIPDGEADESYFDPIVGAMAMWELGNKWFAELDGNIGGFGVGSDLSWKARAGVGYRFTQAFYATLGFMVLDIDIDDSDFEWDVTMYGPYLAIGFRF